MRAMAAYAVAHCEGVLLRYSLHSFDRPVARLAAYPRGDVTTVIECGQVRKIVHLYPFDWFILVQRRGYLLNLS